MILYKRLVIFIMVVFFCLSCSQNSKKMIEASSLDKPPRTPPSQKTTSYVEWSTNTNVKKQTSERLIRENHFNFTDGISEAEALYLSQNYCIQTHKDQYLNIFQPHLKDDADVWAISYQVLPKTLDEMEKKPSDDLFYKILPFIMMINKKTGESSLAIYKLNQKTKKIDVSIERIIHNL